MTIRVLLVDDHPIVREGLRALVQGHLGIDVVGEAADAAQALRQVMACQPDVVVLDLTLPGRGGVDVLPELVATGARVLVLSMHEGEDVVRAAVQEDVQGVAVSSYQGGHVEYFTYLVEQLRAQGRGDIRIYGGGGGVIVPSEIELLHERGVAHIFSPQDGQRMGLAQMINSMIEACDVPPHRDGNVDTTALIAGSEQIGRAHV